MRTVRSVMAIALTVVTVTALLYFPPVVDPILMISFVLMGVAMSSASVIVYYRRLEFLVAEAVHTSFLSILAGLIVEHFTGINYLIPSLLVALCIIYMTGYLVKTGLSTEKASAVITAVASALSVLMIHLTTTRIPLRYSITGLIIGDPLLLTRGDALIAIAISLTIIALSNLSVREIIEIGIDELSARLTGVRVEFYDLLAYSIIGAASVGLLRLAGYVMEHVYLLMPPTVATLYSRSMKEHVFMTEFLGASLSALSYVLSFALDVPPTAVTGLLFILLFAIKYVGMNE